MGVYVIGSGGDYATVAAAEAALSLPEVGGTVYEITGTVTESELTLTNGNYSNGLTVRAKAGEEADGKKGGAFWDTRIRVSANTTNTYFINLNIGSVLCDFNTVARAYFFNCDFGVNATTDVFTANSNVKTTLFNCIVRGDETTADDGLYRSSQDSGVEVFNTTIVGASRYGLLRSVCTNCLIISSGTGDYLSLEAASDYNASSDTSATGSSTTFHNRTTADLADYAGGDYSLSTSSTLVGAGKDGENVGANLPHVATPTALSFNGVDQYATFASVPNRTATEWRIEFRLRNKNTSSNINARILGQNSAYNDYLEIKWNFGGDHILYRVDGVDYSASTGSPTTDDEAFHNYKIVANGSQLEFFLDDVSIGTAAGSPVFKDFERIGAAAVQYANVDIEYLRYYETNGGDTLVYDWDASASTQDNTYVLQETVSGNHATGVNFPADNSAWLDTTDYILDTSNSLTDGLQLAYAHNKEYVQAIAPTNNSGSFGHDNKGQYWEKGAVGSFLDFGDPNLPFTPNGQASFTVVVVGDFQATGSNDSICGYNSVGTPADGWAFKQQQQTSGNLGYSIFPSSDKVGNVAQASGFTAVGFRRSSGNIQFAADGTAGTQDTHSVNSASTTPDIFTVGGCYYTNFGDDLPDGDKIYQVFVWDRELSQAELESVTADPSQLFTPLGSINSTTHEVNTSNPLTTGLLHLAYLHESNTDPVIGSEYGDNSSGVTAEGWQQSGTNKLGITLPSGMNEGNGSVFCLFKSVNTPHSYGRFYSSTSEEFVLERPNVDSTLTAKVNTVAHTLDFYPDIFDNTDKSITTTWDHAGNVVAGTVNGVTNTSAAAYTSGSVGDTELYFGNRTDGTRGNGGLFKIVAVWDRTLSASEIASLEANPYQLVKEKASGATTKTALINFRPSPFSTPSGNWNSTGQPAAGTMFADLIDDSGVATGWGMDVGGSLPSSEGLGVDAVGSGDASWVDQATISDGVWTYNGITGTLTFTGLDNAATYDIEVFASRDATNDRTLEFSVDSFTTTYSLDGASNSTQTEIVPSVSPSSGSITLSLRDASSAITGNLAAIRLIETASGGGTTEVIKETTFSYNVTEEVIKQTTFSFDVLNEVIKETTFGYDLTNEVIKQTTYSFDVLQEVVKETTFSWDQLQEVTKQTTFSFDVEPALTEVIKQTTFGFDILEEVIKQTSFSFDVESALTEVIKQTTFRFDVLQEVVKETTFGFDLLSEVIKQTTFSYDTLQEVVKQTTFSYDTLEEVVKQTTFSFDVQSSLTEVIKQTTFGYNLVNEVIKQTTFSYDINPTTEVIKQTTFAFNVLQEVIKETTFSYNVESEIFTMPTHLMIVLPQDRIMKVLPQDRIMKVLL